MFIFSCEGLRSIFGSCFRYHIYFSKYSRPPVQFMILHFLHFTMLILYRPSERHTIPKLRWYFFYCQFVWFDEFCHGAFRQWMPQWTSTKLHLKLNPWIASLSWNEQWHCFDLFRIENGSFGSAQVQDTCQPHCAWHWKVQDLDLHWWCCLAMLNISLQVPVDLKGLHHCQTYNHLDQMLILYHLI